MKTLCLAALLVPLFAIAEPVAAQQQPPRPETRALDQAVEFPFHLIGGHILVDGVRVNGRGPYRFLVDTGAQGAGRVSSSIAAELGLPEVGRAGASDGSGGPPVELVIHGVTNLELGPLRFANLEMVGRPTSARTEGVAGVLGVDLFRGNLLTIDYGRGVLRVEPGALPEPDGASVLPLAESPIPTVMAQLGGQALAARIDTGSPGFITVGQQTADQLRFTQPLAATAQVQTVSGTFQMSQGPIDGALEIGNLRVASPVVSVVPHFRGINLGSEFLRTYVTTLDLDHGRIRMTPAANGGPPPTRRYGFLMAPPREGETELVLRGAAPGSPAERAGFRPEDRIVALNGVAIADWGGRLAEVMRTSPLRVRYSRDGETREVQITLDAS